MTKKISLVVNDAGGGHQASGRALATAIAQYCPHWQTQEVDAYRDVLNFPATYGYNLLLRLNWTAPFWPLLVPPFLWYKKLRQQVWLTKLRKYWQQQQPDLVVSLIPFINRELYDSWQQVKPGAPFFILMTDLASDPPHFWLEPWEQQQNLFVICPTPKAIEQALNLGYPKSQLFSTSGVILHPRFYEPLDSMDKIPVASSSTFDRDRERQALGLDPNLTTGVVFFGGQGSKSMLRIAQRLSTANLPLQLIFLCGKNQSLVEKLGGFPHSHAWIVEGFTHSVPYYLSLADFLIGKPGPASLSEAIACNLPVITIYNSSTLWQERYNIEWVREKQLGIVIENWEEVDGAVAKLMQSQTMAYYQHNVGTIENRAIFEVLNILAKT